MARVASRTGLWKLRIVKRSMAAGFGVLPKRWIFERTFAWITRNRRLARDFESYAGTVVVFIHLAMIRIMLRRVGQTSPHEPELSGWALSLTESESRRRLTIRLR